MIQSIVFCVLLALNVAVGTKFNRTELEIGHGNFSWQNCNKTIVPMSFRHFSLSPHPIQLGQTLVISAEFDVTKHVGTTNSFKVEISTYLVNEGHAYYLCNYNSRLCGTKDVCKLLSDRHLPHLDTVKNEGSNSGCPLKPNTYIMNNIPFLTNRGYTTEGRYLIEINFTEENAPVGCIATRICIGNC